MAIRLDILVEGIVEFDLARRQFQRRERDGGGIRRDSEPLTVHVVAIGNREFHLHGLPVDLHRRKAERLFGRQKIVRGAGRQGEGRHGDQQQPQLQQAAQGQECRQRHISGNQTSNSRPAGLPGHPRQIGRQPGRDRHGNDLGHFIRMSTPKRCLQPRIRRPGSLDQ